MSRPQEGSSETPVVLIKAEAWSAALRLGWALGPKDSKVSNCRAGQLAGTQPSLLRAASRPGAGAIQKHCGPVLCSKLAKPDAPGHSVGRQLCPCPHMSPKPPGAGTLALSCPLVSWTVTSHVQLLRAAFSGPGL